METETLWMFQPGQLSLEEVSAIQDTLEYFAWLEQIATEMGHRDTEWWHSKN